MPKKNCKFFDYSQFITVIVRMNGRNEIPPNDSDGVAKLVGLLVESQARLDYAYNYSNLSSTVIAAHFHDGKQGVNGPIVHTIDINSFVGSWTNISPDLIDKIKKGKIYVNIHTTNFPDGE